MTHDKKIGIMCAKAMSSARKDEYKFSSCLHVRKFVFGFFDRAALCGRPCEAREFCTAGERPKNESTREFALRMSDESEREKWTMEGKKYILTAEGLKKYEDELYYLKNERYKEITQAIKEARAQGDLSENAEYQAAKEEQRQVDARIEELEEMLTNVEVVDESEDNSVVRIGSMVRIKDLEFDEELNYQIVGGSEANTDENMISNESPLGQALIGSVEGDIVNVQAPIGEIRYQVLEIGKRERN